MSRQQEQILKTLQKLRTHPSADELYWRVKEQLPRISLGTVYRNLDQLVSSGQVIKHSIPGESARYDGMLDTHFHLYCTHCKKLYDFPKKTFNPFLSWMNQMKKKGVSHYHLTLEGLCPQCRKKQKGGTLHES